MKKKILLCSISMFLMSSLIVGCTNKEEKNIINIEETSIKEKVEVKIGNLSGNINNGGHIAYNEDYIVFSTENALWRIDHEYGDLIKLSGKRCKYINVYNDQIYYLEVLDDGVQPMVMNIDGTNKEPIGDKKSSINEYDNFTVINDMIFFISPNTKLGKATYTYLDKEVTYTYGTNRSIYSMDLDGDNVEEVVSDIGNLSPQMCSKDNFLYYYTNYFCGASQDSFVRYYKTNILNGETEEVVEIENTNNNIISEYGMLTSNSSILVSNDSLLVSDLSNGTGTNYTTIYRYDINDEAKSGEYLDYNIIGNQVVVDGDYLYFYGVKDNSLESKSVEVGIYKVNLEDDKDIIMIKDFGMFQNIEQAPIINMYIVDDAVLYFEYDYYKNTILHIIDSKTFKESIIDNLK